MRNRLDLLRVHTDVELQLPNKIYRFKEYLSRGDSPTIGHQVMRSKPSAQFCKSVLTLSDCALIYSLMLCTSCPVLPIFHVVSLRLITSGARNPCLVHFVIVIIQATLTSQ